LPWLAWWNSPTKFLPLEVKSDRGTSSFPASSCKGKLVCFKRLWAIAPAHAVSSSENCLPSQIRQSTLSLAAGRTYCTTAARLTKAAASTAGASCTLGVWVPLVVLMNNRRPCTRSGAVERESVHVEASHFRPAPLSSEAVAQLATGR